MIKDSELLKITHLITKIWNLDTLKNLEMEDLEFASEITLKIAKIIQKNVISNNTTVNYLIEETLKVTTAAFKEPSFQKWRQAVKDWEDLSELIIPINDKAAVSCGGLAALIMSRSFYNIETKNCT